MKATPRRFGRVVGLILGSVLCGGALWALAPEGSEAPQDHARAPAMDQASRLRDAIDLLRRSRPDVVTASVPAAEDSLGGLLGGPAGAAKLGPVLSAIAVNPTRPEDDPLWPEVVREISSLWNADTLSWGLDLMLSETRPRARRAVISSLASLATSDRARVMRPDQRQLLVDHLIDLYPQTPASERPGILTALRRSGADDAAEVLLGRGLDSEYALAIHREQKTDVERSVREAEAREREARTFAQSQIGAGQQNPEMAPPVAPPDNGVEPVADPVPQAPLPP